MPTSDPADAPPLHPLFSKTYTLHRITPLHGFPALTKSGLLPHARALTAQLRGDLIRNPTSTSIDVDVPTSTTATTGSLKSCTWLPVPTNPSLPGVTGVEIKIEYEHAIHSALLLHAEESRARSRPQPNTRGAKKGFTNLPLLLVRMPAQARETLLQYLAATFDAVVTPLHVPEAMVRNALGDWVQGRGVRAGEVKITFRPPLHSPGSGGVHDGERGNKGGVRTMAITVAARDVRRFAKRGWWKSVAAYLRDVCGVEILAGDGVGKDGREGWVLQKAVCRGFVLQAGDAVAGKWKALETRGEAEEVMMRRLLGTLVGVAEE